MAISCTDANFDTQDYIGDATPDLAIPTTCEEGDLLICGIHDRSEGMTVDSVVDSVNGAWTLIEGPTTSAYSTIRSWLYYFPNSAAGSATVTVTFSGTTGNSHVAVGRVTGAATADALGPHSTVDAPVAALTLTSGTLTAARAGALIGFLASNNNYAITGVDTDEVNVTNEQARGHIVYQPFAAAGDYALAATFASVTFGLFAAAIFYEPAAAGLSAFVAEQQRSTTF